jgi:stage 0 sporulation protein B (sporulation initiation phosphotransferase)
VEAGQAVNIIRRLRHDFGNYLQVILGYIDLGQPQQAREYILKVVEELAEGRYIFESQDNEAALFFFEQLLKARDLGIILRYKEINIKKWGLLKERNEPIKTLSSLSSQFEGWGDNIKVNLSLNSSGNKVKMLFEWQQPQAGQLEGIIEELE